MNNCVHSYTITGEYIVECYQSDTYEDFGNKAASQKAASQKEAAQKAAAQKAVFAQKAAAQKAAAKEMQIRYKVNVSKNATGNAKKNVTKKRIINPKLSAYLSSGVYASVPQNNNTYQGDTTYQGDNTNQGDNNNSSGNLGGDSETNVNNELPEF